VTLRRRQARGDQRLLRHRSLLDAATAMSGYLPERPDRRKRDTLETGPHDYGRQSAVPRATIHSCGWPVTSERSSGQRHVIAVELLRRVDTKLATLLKRALDCKTQAGYESTDIRRADAVSCVRWARQLVEAAESRLHAGRIQVAFCSGVGLPDSDAVIRGRSPG
jgi:hypothetical protein